MNEQYQRDKRFIQTEFRNFRNPGSLGMIVNCLVDTSAEFTCIPEELAEQMGFRLNNKIHKRLVRISSQVYHVSNVVFSNIRIGKRYFDDHMVCIVPELETPLIGWDILGDSSVFAEVGGLIFGEVLHLLENLSNFKEKAVLILGQDTTEIDRLRAIQKSLRNFGTIGIVVKDISDIEIQSIEEKVNMLASICRYVICENSVASGHIDELKICANNRFVTAIIQQEGMGATWMQADYPMDFNFMKTFKYTNLISIDSCVNQAVKWAQAKIEERRKFFNNLYSWRGTP